MPGWVSCGADIIETPRRFDCAVIARNPIATSMSDSLPAPAHDVAPTSNVNALRPAPSSRMPSLNQLAARMNNNANANNSSSSSAQPLSGAARHRLPTSLLARTSSTSVATNSSAADSTAVQPPTTRSTSPALSSQRSSSPAGSARDGPDPTPAAGSGTELTAELLERLNLGTAEGAGATSTRSSEGTAASTGANVPANGRSSSTMPARGYKNVPTLEAITERLRKARALSVDGTEAPPQPAAAPATTTNEAAAPNQKEKEHPLQYPWCVAVTCRPIIRSDNWSS